MSEGVFGKEPSDTKAQHLAHQYANTSEQFRRGNETNSD